MELPWGEKFLEKLASVIMEPSTARIRLNPDRTIDGELRVEAPKSLADWRAFIQGLETDYWNVLASTPQLFRYGWWLRLGARFKRTTQKWRTYKLSVFKGGFEQVMVQTVRTMDDAGEVWATLREVIASVLNAYLSPDPRTGKMRPEYKLTHVLVRIHRGPRAPLY